MNSWFDLSSILSILSILCKVVTNGSVYFDIYVLSKFTFTYGKNNCYKTHFSESNKNGSNKLGKVAQPSKTYDHYLIYNDQYFDFICLMAYVFFII
ncbi:hypothetical protein BpHYR1_044250 [Brachionus plicatilis]|uniref:Uncharacterized protein n=1 Tax=Brachionus plicatilis TaxID=10195 RepID=A0A3M7QU78_BRAPC|nr:hypothetical protein BpHYR1_044250 [Brachionus plicatilis]